MRRDILPDGDPSEMKIALPAKDLSELAEQDLGQVLGVLDKLARGLSRIIQCVRLPKDDETFLFEIFHDVLAAR